MHRNLNFLKIHWATNLDFIKRAGVLVIAFVCTFLFHCDAQNDNKRNPNTKFLVREGLIKYKLRLYPLPYKKSKDLHITKYVRMHFYDSGTIKDYEGDYLSDSGIVKIEKRDSTYTSIFENGNRVTTKDRYNILPEVLSVDNLTCLPPVFRDRISRRKLKSIKKIVCDRYYATFIWHKNNLGKLEEKRGGGISVYKNITFSISSSYDNKYYVILTAYEYTEL
jgi:hypothetical protein